MTFVIGLLIGGFISHSWLDALLKSFVFGTAMVAINYLLMNDTRITMIMSNGMNVKIAVLFEFGTVLIGGLLGFMV